MRRIDPKAYPLKSLHQNLLSTVAPRPIAFASTLSQEGIVNLSPFSFFNAFGSNPPIIAFSPARRGRDNTTKDTYENIRTTEEVVINVVNYPIVEQSVVASTEYPETHDEFEKAGFTKVEAETVKPYRVAESPVHLECRLRDLINYAEVNGAANIAICEVQLMHIAESAYGNGEYPDPRNLDLIGRMGQDWYDRAAEGLFEISAPPGNDNIGFDHMPKAVLESPVLTGNELAKLARFQRFPEAETVAQVKAEPQIAGLYQTHQNEPERLEVALHEVAKALIQQGAIEKAWCALMGNKS